MEEHLHILDGALYHALIYLGYAFLSGHMIWRLLGARSSTGGYPGEARPGEIPATERTYSLVGIGMVLSGSILGLLQGIWTMELAYTPRNITLVVGQTMFGRSWLTQAGFASVTVMVRILMLRGWRIPGGVLLVSVGLALVAQTSLGHASRTGLMAWPMLIQSLHALAVTTWLAGLLVLMERLVHGGYPDLKSPLMHFSRLSILCFVLLLPTGLWSTLQLVPNLSAMLSPYGLILGLKLCFVMAVLGIAAGHHVWRLPRFRRNPTEASAWEAMDRWVMAEVFMAFMAILLAALLSQVAPPDAINPL